MPQEPEIDRSPFIARMVFAPGAAAVAFIFSLGLLQSLFPQMASGVRLCFQTVIALGVAVAVARFLPKGPSRSASKTFWTRTLTAIAICAGWIAVAAWFVGAYIQEDRHPARATGNYTILLRRQYYTPAQVVIDHLAISTFIGAGVCLVLSGWVLGSLQRRRASIGHESSNEPALWRICLLFAAAIVAFVFSGWALRVVVPQTPPGLVACVQIVIAFAAFVLSARLLIQPDHVEKPPLPPKSFRIAARTVSLGVVASFFVMIYLAANTTALPNHPIGDYTVLAQIKSGRRYMTPLQSLVQEIAVWTFLGGTVSMLAIGKALEYLAKRRASTAEPPAGGDS